MVLSIIGNDIKKIHQFKLIYIDFIMLHYFPPTQLDPVEKDVNKEHRNGLYNVHARVICNYRRWHILWMIFFNDDQVHILQQCCFFF